MPPDLLNVVIDISDQSGCPFVLIGEEELPGVIQQNKRAWSRCHQTVAFQPLTIPDVILYVREATGLTLSAEVAALLHKCSNGDFRLLAREVHSLIKFANAKETRDIDLDLAQLAVSVGLRGPKENGNGNRRRSGGIAA